MTRLGPRVRAVLTAVGLVAILVVGGVVVHLTPGEDDWQDGFVTSGEVGETLTGRTLQVTVHGAEVADEVTSSRGWTGETPGVWLVVDTTVTAMLGDVGFGLSELDIDGVRYEASERPDSSSIEGGSLAAGIPLRGPLAFEIPADAIDAGQATLRFATNGDPRLDSVLEVPLRLDGLEHRDTLELPAIDEGAA